MFKLGYIDDKYVRIDTVCIIIKTHFCKLITSFVILLLIYGCQSSPSTLNDPDSNQSKKTLPPELHNRVTNWSIPILMDLMLERCETEFNSSAKNLEISRKMKSTWLAENPERLLSKNEEDELMNEVILFLNIDTINSVDQIPSSMREKTKEWALKGLTESIEDDGEMAEICEDPSLMIFALISRTQ